MTAKISVLILCTGNSARSQMAEGIVRHLFGAQCEVYSAGTHPSIVNPYAIRAMNQIGIDISGHRSKNLLEYIQTPFDYVITVCGNADQRCPNFPGPAQRLHWGFRDPDQSGSDAENLADFCEIRDEILAKFKQDWPKILNAHTGTSTAVTEISIPELQLFKKGKVRSVYDLGERLLIVASDRISAFDCILPNGIPGKGRILTEMSAFWFDRLKHICPNHLISITMTHFPDAVQHHAKWLDKRAMLVKKTDLIPVECVVRGYIIGSGWKEYQSTGSVCGIPLPAGLKLAEKLPTPIFTPATKAESGHDENISFEVMSSIVGSETAEKLRKISLALYNAAQEHALTKGIIIADTKFEFGLLNGKIVLIDEIFTPDSSRFWPAHSYRVGESPVSCDKQIVRDYLESLDWNKQPPAPELPDEVVQKTLNEYKKIFQLIAG